MEYLKALFEAGALTFEQFVEAVTKAGIKLANLADGGYVDKQKLEDKVAEIKAMKVQLEDANKAIEASKELDVEGIKKQAEDWKVKFEQAQEDAKKATYKMQIAAIVEKENFSSAAAKKAFLADLLAKELPIEGETLLGYTDFKNAYTETDPKAFAQDAQGKPYAIPPLGGGAPVKMTKADFAKLTYNERVKLKNEHPEEYKLLRG